MKPIRPVRNAVESAPTYPSLEDELDRRGLARRGFLAAALAAGAGAAAGCMGVAPRPRYLRGRWHAAQIAFTRPVCLSGCGIGVQRQRFGAVHVSSPNARFVEHLRSAAARAILGARLTDSARGVLCTGATLDVYTDQVQRRLEAELRAFYRRASGFTLRPGELSVRLVPVGAAAR